MAGALTGAMREVVVLAGGFGTRLRDTVADCPKCLAPVAGRPFLDWQFEYLRRQGVGRVVLALGYRAEQVLAHVRAMRYDIDIAWEIEREPLGTGGALRAAFRHVQGESAFALNGDTLLLADLAELAGRSGERVVVAVRHVDDGARYGTVRVVADRITGFVEKGAAGPGLINGGVYWLHTGAFDGFALPAAFSFERDYLAAHVATLAPRAVATTAFFIDIGTPEDFRRAQHLIPQALAPAA